MTKEREDYEANPKICPLCKNPIPYEKRFQKYCSRTCMYKAKEKPEEEKAVPQDRKEYFKQYRKNHKAGIKAHNDKYYAANKDKIHVQQKIYKATHKDVVAACKARYQAKHKEDKAAYDAHRRSIRRTCQKCGQWFYEEDDTIKYCPSCREQN